MLVSNGNFHGQPLAFALDALAMAVAELASISERRVERLVNPNLSRRAAGVPDRRRRAQLRVHDPAVRRRVARLREQGRSCHPASVDSIPTSAGQEDHVSMGNASGLKAWQVLANSERALAIELLAGAQAVEFLAPLEPGRGGRATHGVRPVAVAAPARGPLAVGATSRRSRDAIRDGSLARRGRGRGRGAANEAPPPALGLAGGAAAEASVPRHDRSSTASLAVVIVLVSRRPAEQSARQSSSRRSSSSSRRPASRSTAGWRCARAGCASATGGGAVTVAASRRRARRGALRRPLGDPRAARHRAERALVADRGAAAHAAQQPRPRGRRAAGGARRLRRLRARRRASTRRCSAIVRSLLELGRRRDAARAERQAGRRVPDARGRAARADRELAARARSWATWDEFRRLEALGLTMFGQMTAGSWIYIGTQGILQGTYQTFAAAGEKHFGSADLAGRTILTAGLGGMGGAQPLAATHRRRGDPLRRGRPVADRAPARDALPRRGDRLARRRARPRARRGRGAAARSRSACSATPPTSCPSWRGAASTSTSSPTRPRRTTR